MLAFLSTLPGLLKLSENKLAYLAINLLFILAFALIYWIWGTPEHFKTVNTTEPQYLSVLDALYISFTNHCTLGYGDIVPISPWMRLVTIVHIVIMISYLFLISV